MINRGVTDRSARVLELHVGRCADLESGAARWLNVDGELLFVLSALSVTAIGAEHMQAAWMEWFRRRVWGWGRPGDVGPAGPITGAYYIAPSLSAREPVSITFRRGVLTGLLSPHHFDAATAANLTALVPDVAAAGWVWTPRRTVRVA